MSVQAQTISANTNHANVQNLRGWSIRGDATLVVRLRRGAVGGQILATIAGNSHELFPDIIDAVAGTYVEVVTATFTEGVLYYT